MILRPARFNPRRTLLAPLVIGLLSLAGVAGRATGNEEKRVARFAADLAALSPKVSKSEARALAECAQTSMKELRKEYRVVWPPLLHNLLIYYGFRKRGYCFHWTDDLYARLQSIKPRTLELGRAIAYEDGAHENNCLVVGARGRPFREALLIDGWRYSGRFVWLPVSKDHYPWMPYVSKQIQAPTTANPRTRKGSSKCVACTRVN